MKNKEISPVAAGIVIAVIVLVVGYFIYMRTGGSGAEQATQQSNPMPQEASNFLKQMMERGPQQPPNAPPSGGSR